MALIIEFHCLCPVVHERPQVYRFSSQTQTFFRTVGDLLDMPDASPEAVMKRLEAVLERRIDVDPDARLRTSHDANSWAADHSVDVAID